MRYIARKPCDPKMPRPRLDWDDDLIGPLNVTVHEPDDSPQWTGLYDASGNELCRTRDRLPMGFRAK